MTYQIDAPAPGATGSEGNAKPNALNNTMPTNLQQYVADDHGAADQLVPDEGAALAHLEMLFGRAVNDGLIEIAWTPAGNPQRGPSAARLFDVTDVEDAAAFACEVNAIEGQNVYVGMALRQPGTFPGARASDADFMAVWALAADCDDKAASDRAKEYMRGQDLRPSAYVVTGSLPASVGMRAQLWFSLTDPITDPATFRDMQARLAHHLGGDPSIKNPSRIMRLAGSIAWPAKPGRVIERTEWHVSV